MDIGLLILRVVIGGTLAAHGLQKLAGWFGGSGLPATATMMERLGFVPGTRAALLAGLGETGGGVFLALGLLTPAASAVLVGVMVVASATRHFPKGFFLKNGGFEYNLVLASGALSLAFTGPGSLSIDGALGLARNGALWGAAALIAGIAGGAIQLARRQARPGSKEDRA